MTDYSPELTYPKQDRRTISPEMLEKLRVTVIEFFSQGLFHQVGIRDIAKKAGVGPQTIYKYFGNKDSLIFACILPDLAHLEEEVRQKIDQTSGNALDQLDTFLTTVVSFYLAHPQLAEIVFLSITARQRTIDPQFSERYLVKLLEDILAQGQQQGCVRADASVMDLHDTLSGAFSQYITRKLTEPSSLKTMDIAAECQRLIRLTRPLITG
ncbi:TetR/AcrR family transcriptional regulator [Aestuariicella hydrocarbonica]|uniref:TetR/AcrR family transcriptional regulator n=1 Tax=Pseudomaricurvus hydrocarbonicus TaxID=1470433 RepID=A0A9E5JU89_9GAMM|nr:TetR/AcrR family transcriptional regulator [Aestuariicella hydrocarbonica]NHO66933.1 TetR/AcrR family transcriptional regulator [Aestuariicella hydrocarbonica]